MRKCSFVLSLFLLAGIMLFTGCEEEKKKEFKLVSLMTDGGLDLAGATLVTDVPEDALIIATFSSNVDPATVSTTSFKITNTDEATLQDYTLATVGPVVTATPTEGWDGGSQFSIEISTAIEGTNGVAFSGNTLGFRTSGMNIPNDEYMVLHLSFDDQTATDETGNHTVTTVGTLGFTDDRNNTANAAAYFTGEGNLVEVAYAADLISPSITISFWFKTASADYEGMETTDPPQMRWPMGLAAERGYFLEMGRRSNDPQADGYPKFFLKYGTAHVNAGNNAATNPKGTAWTEVNDNSDENYDAGSTGSGWSYVISALTGNSDFMKTSVTDRWVHLVMTFDATARTKTIYVNGVRYAAFQWNTNGYDWLMSDLTLWDMLNDGVTPVDGLEASLTLGSACSSTSTSTGWCNYQDVLLKDSNQKNFFKGAIDEFRIFSVPFTETEVATLYANEQ